MNKTALIALFAVLATGCASRGSQYTPIVDMKGRDWAQFSQDTGECQVYARQRPGAAAGAIAGALAGALLGAALAPRGYRNNVAGYGAVAGGVGAAAGANESQESIIRRCLAGRGYNVLG